MGKWESVLLFIINENYLFYFSKYALLYEDLVILLGFGLGVIITSHFIHNRYRERACLEVDTAFE